MSNDLDDILQFTKTCPYCGKTITVKVKIVGDLLDYTATLQVLKHE